MGGEEIVKLGLILISRLVLVCAFLLISRVPILNLTEMAQQILESEISHPDQIRSSLSSALAAQRSVLPDGLVPAPSGAPNKTPGTVEDARRSDEETELEKDVKEMAQKIMKYRASLPDQLLNTLDSTLASQRPVFPDDMAPTPSVAQIAEEGPSDGEMAKKIQLLKQKYSDNASAIPAVLKRMKDCVTKIDNLDSCNGITHPAFKRMKDCSSLP